MRVITGTAKGRRLKALKGKETRPTLDRIKEALFNIIGNDVTDIKFLDLYAGTGAIGIEALSRGAEEAVFIDKNPQAVQIIKKNLELTGLSEKAEVYCQDIVRGLENLGIKKGKFDIIFLDPPYQRNLIEPTLQKISTHNLLTFDGIVIVESSKSDDIPNTTGSLTLYRREVYGDTALGFYKR